MKRVCALLALFAILAGMSVPVWAAQDQGYIIEIDDSGAATTQELIVSYPHIGAGDSFEQNIRVVNHTADAFSIRLKKAELDGDDTLLSAVTIRLVGAEGSITLGRRDLDKTDWPSFFSIAGNRDGSFTLQTLVGELVNEQQGAACTIRYSFEIVNLDAQPGEKPPPTGDTTRPARDAVVCAVAVSSLIALIFVRRKRKGGKKPL